MSGIVTARNYNCPKCGLDFQVYHTHPDELNTHCHWCHGPVTFLDFAKPLPRIMKELVNELRQLTDPATLKTDEEAAADRTRAGQICRQLGYRDRDDVFERYGRYGQNIVE